MLISKRRRFIHTCGRKGWHTRGSKSNFHGTATEPNKPVDVDFKIEREWDPSKRYWEEATVKETFYVAINAEDSTEDKIFYLPTEFPKLLIDKEKYYEFSTALFYTDKSILWEISDVWVESQLKTTTTSSVPLQMSNVGIRMFDCEGDMTILDRIYPVNNITQKWNVLNVTPVDYRDGWVTAAHSGMKDICRQLLYRNGVGNLSYPVCIEPYLKKTEKYLEGYIDTVYKGICCITSHGYKNCFDLQFLPQDISNWDAHVLKDIQDYKMVYGTIPATDALSYKYNYLPNVSKFQGNKNLKPLMFCVDPLYNGTDIMPTTVRIKIHYSHTFQVYKKNPIFENPKLIASTITFTIQQVNLVTILLIRQQPWQILLTLPRTQNM